MAPVEVPAAAGHWTQRPAPPEDAEPITQAQAELANQQAQSAQQTGWKLTLAHDSSSTATTPTPKPEPEKSWAATNWTQPPTEAPTPKDATPDADATQEITAATQQPTTRWSQPTGDDTAAASGGWGPTPTGPADDSLLSAENIPTSDSSSAPWGSPVEVLPPQSSSDQQEGDSAEGGTAGTEPSDNGGWGTNAQEASNGGWGTQQTAADGWGDAGTQQGSGNAGGSSASGTAAAGGWATSRQETGTDGWGTPANQQPATQDPAAAGWGVSAQQEPAADGWGAGAQQETAADGWGTSAQQEPAANGWGAGAPQETAASGWGAGAPQETAASGWGAGAQQEAAADGWGASAAQQGGAGGGDASGPQQSGTGGWGSSGSAQASGGGWGGSVVQTPDAGQWGSNAAPQPTTQWGAAGATGQQTSTQWGSTGQQTQQQTAGAWQNTDPSQWQGDNGPQGGGVRKGRDKSKDSDSGGGMNKTPLIIGSAVALVILVVVAVFLIVNGGDKKTADPGTSPAPQPTGSAPTTPTTGAPGTKPGQSKNPKLHEGNRISSDAISFPRQASGWSDRKRLIPQLLNSSGQYVLLQKDFDGSNDWYADMFVGGLGTATPFNGDPKATATALLTQVHNMNYGNIPVTYKAVRNGAVKRSDKAGWYFQETVTAKSPKVTSVLLLTVAVFDLGDGTAVAYISDIPTNRPDLKTAEAQVYKGINVG
ncbi:hypothetical protein [Kribbella sp. NPDC023855]|uniref:hypothetical protein n=1 Tax=Kribbella sp. NPDC023855 TaxID=3154698 RepID=UPI0034028CB0